MSAMTRDLSGLAVNPEDSSIFRSPDHPIT
jgi:hypothetical protein